ncbi:hypothetical protein ACLB2K_068057 [Fragaria x ananassa]
MKPLQHIMQLSEALTPSLQANLFLVIKPLFQQVGFLNWVSSNQISDGNLVLFDESNTPIWSTNVASNITLGTSIQAVLLDDGNFVLRLESGSSHPLWQSFDHPSHTFLPASKFGFNRVTKQSQMLISWKNSEDPSPGQFSLELDPTTNSYIIKWNRSKQYWTSGSWDENEHTFSLLPEMKLNYIYNQSYVTNENESYFTYSLHDASITSRLIMDVTGQLKQLSWFKAQGWNLFWDQPKRQCEVYGLCGAFSSCNENSLPFCKCLMGFEPKSVTRWDLQDYSDGCSRKTRLNCGNVTGVDGTSDSRYGYSSSSSECSTWKGDLLADENGRTVYIRIAASDYKNLKSRKRTIVITTVPATAGLLTIVFFGYFLMKKTLGKRRTSKNLSAAGVENDTELQLFSLRSILVATNNFSEGNKLGEGGFGPVYKGILPENQEVAIKRLSKKSRQGQQEFMNELKLIAKLQHTNLVRLMGCCIEAEEMILMYEYMPNRSLDKFLFDPSEKTKLDWGKRFRIIEAVTCPLSMHAMKNASFCRFERVLTLSEWAWDLWKEGRGTEVIDASVRETIPVHEALRCIHVGLLCVQESAADRPAMASVIHMLQGKEATSLPPANEPAFSTQTNINTATGYSFQTSINYSNNELTISLPEAR